ncbi:MAG: ubiquinol-cytochrome C chaperone [Pseudomonadota bacterium]|nr:ubiquinol-cytochrome C chaperone [Pseudomonadota bacterium]
MLRRLFARLTERADRGAALFEALVDEARKPHWFVEGAVPDSVDGRFAMLATVVALATVRLESVSDDTRLASVALTERFIAAMDAEHRQMGVSDPAIGKTVRKLVGALARRVALWRDSGSGEAWRETTARSVYGDGPVSRFALGHTASKLALLKERLATASDADLIEGSI